MNFSKIVGRARSGDSSLVRMGTSPNSSRVRDRVRNREKLHLWLWRTGIWQNWDSCAFGLVTSSHGALRLWKTLDTPCQCVAGAASLAGSVKELSLRHSSSSQQLFLSSSVWRARADCRSCSTLNAPWTRWRFPSIAQWLKRGTGGSVPHAPMLSLPPLLRSTTRLSRMDTDHHHHHHHRLLRKKQHVEIHT